MNKLIGIIVILAGLISSGLFFYAGILIEISGESLTMLRSQGGNSVAEAYYQEIGRFGIAYSFLSYALGLGVLSVSLGLGGILITKKHD